MKWVFYGAAMQSSLNHEDRVPVHELLIDTIKRMGAGVVSEHTVGRNFQESARLMEQTLGPLPQEESARAVLIRRKIIRILEGALDAAVFEVSEPSPGTGIEIAHVYNRPRLGLTAIPILALYQKGCLPHHLSSMDHGVNADVLPQLFVQEYENLIQAGMMVSEFLMPLLGHERCRDGIPAQLRDSSFGCTPRYRP